MDPPGRALEQSLPNLYLGEEGPLAGDISCVVALQDTIQLVFVVPLYILV